LGRIISENTFNKLLEFEAFDPQNAYKVSELFSDLKKGIWSELKTHQPIDIYRRNLQKIYVEKLIDYIQPEEKKATVSFGSRSSMPAKPKLDSDLNDGLSIVKGQARSLISEIQQALPSITDNESRLHLLDVVDRLKTALDPKS
jgi:hypothetical protein